MPQPAPERGPKHDALDIFLGQWTAEGTAFGATDPSQDSRANGQEWQSTHRAFWHTGNFFLVQDERAFVGGAPFDTLAVMGVDPRSGEYFSRGFENHGFYRDYRMTIDGKLWRIDGESERATIEFTDDDRRQVIHWEQKPEDEWLPLCDRIATRVDP